jgi:hypothetical protein
MKTEAFLTAICWTAGTLALIGAATTNSTLMAIAGIIAAVAALLWGLLMHIDEKRF